MQPTRASTWIGEDIDASAVDHYEAWRFFTSGQFTQLRAISADWRSGGDATRVPSGFSRAIEVWEILFYVTEVFELAARLALSPAGDDPMVVDLRLHITDDRALVVAQSSRAEFFEPYQAPIDGLRRTVEVARSGLIASAHELAVETAQEMFSRFGWNVARAQLVEHQQELLSYR